MAAQSLLERGLVMVNGGKKVLGISLGVAAVAVVVAVGWKALFPPVPEPELQTLCSYMRSAARAQCTVAVAPEAFPVGNVLVLPDPPNPNAPLPITYRDFASVCWLKPEEQEDIRKRLARPAADVSLFGFSVDATRKLRSGASVDLAEADNFKFIAGANSDRIRNIDVAIRAAKVLVIDQGQLESLLHRPEVREDCFSRLLGSRTRLVVSVIFSSGLDYSVVTTGNDRLNLDAAVKAGYVNVDLGPRATSSSKVTTTLSSTDPRVIGVVFADDMMTADLEKLVTRGNSIVASGQNRVAATIRYPGASLSPEVTIPQNPDGSLPNVRPDAVAATLAPALRQIIENSPSDRGNPTIRLSRIPEFAGTATSRSTNSVAGAYASVASVVWDTNVKVHNTGADALLTWAGIDYFSARTTQNVALPLTVRLDQQVSGEFQVFKRRDGRENLLITVSRESAGSDAGSTASPIRIRVLDSTNKLVVPETALNLSEIEADGRTVTVPLVDAGVYRAIALQTPTISDIPGQLDIKSQLTVAASLAPIRNERLVPTPASNAPMAPAPIRP